MYSSSLDDAIAAHAAVVPIDARIKVEVDPGRLEVGQLVCAVGSGAQALLWREQRAEVALQLTKNHEVRVELQNLVSPVGTFG